MGFALRRFGRIRLAFAPSVVVIVALVAVLTATATNASAQDTEISCTRTGDTIEWTPFFRVHVRGSQTPGDNSVWIATFTGAIGNQVSSYAITDADAAKAPGDTYFLRYRTDDNATVVDVECTSAAEPPVDPPAGDFSCTHNDGELSWSQLDVSRNLFNIRRANPDGTTSWVASVQGNDANTFNVDPGVDYLIRYRITFSPGDTRTFNVACADGDTPTPVTCSTGFFGFLQETGFDVQVDGLADGISYTLFLNDEEIRSNAFPVEAVEFTGRDANELFRVDNFNDRFYEVEIAPSNDLTARISCGSTGTERLPVSTCSISDNGGGEIEVFVSPARNLGFEIAIDGVIVPSSPNFSDQPGGPPIFYEVQGDPQSAFTIVQDAGVVDCAGDEVGVDPVASFCTQIDGDTLLLNLDGAFDDQYHIRRVNPDGSSTWVSTDSGDLVSTRIGQGEFFVRYRIDDAARTIVDNPCVPE